MGKATKTNILSAAFGGKRLKGRTTLPQWIAGLGMTLIAVVLWIVGALEPVERLTLDWRAQYFGYFAPGPSDRIAIVAIDQQSLDTIGRWPWPRKDLGYIIDEMRIAGARVIALDLLLDDPEVPIRRADGKLEQGDELLAEFIKSHGAVVLAAGFKFGEAVPSRGLTVADGGGGAGAKREGTLEDVYRELSARPELLELDDAALVAQLRKTMLIDDASGLRNSPELLRLRSHAATARLLMSKEPGSTIPRPATVVSSGVGLPLSVSQQVPVSVVGHAAARIGNVSFNSFDADGKTRRMPLVVEHHGVLWPNLGLSAAMLQLGLNPADARFGGGELIISTGDASRRLHVMQASVKPGRFDGMHYISWPRSLVGKPAGKSLEDWQWAFYNAQANVAAEISIGVVFKPERINRLTQENVQQISKAIHKVYLTGVLAGESEENPGSYLGKTEQQECTDDLNMLRDIPIDHALFKGPFDRVIQRLAPLRSRGAAEIAVLLAFSGFNALPSSLGRVKDLQAAELACERALREIDDGRKEFEVARTNLKKLLDGKICFVGWTATGSIADFVSTSIDPKTPGPHLHAAIANSVLTSFERRPASSQTDLFAIAVAGLVGTIVGVRSSVLIGPVLAAAVIGAWFAVVGLVFWDAQRLILSFSGPAAALFLSVSGIFVYRLLIEQRSRRRTEERFKSRVAPQVVEFLVNNPELDTMKPQRKELSVMFTDLAGFTSTAERLGSVKTAEVLAKYLGTMTDIVLATGATFDKYIGDAIVTFWGAPIDDPLHAAHACKAVMDMLHKLDDMNAAGEFADVGPSGLGMRVGLSAGEVMVGDFGAPPKNSSYTTLGDTTNLAARLEGANKAFGSRVLVSAAFRDLAIAHCAAQGAASPMLRWRRLGRVRVKGKAVPIEVFEMVGDLKPRGDRTDEWILITDAIVNAYEAGDFDACDAAIAKYADRIGDEAILSLYRDQMIEWSARVDRATAFDGCIELKEK